MIHNKAEALAGKRVMMFSYGSGLAATLFSLKVNGDVSFIRDTVKVDERLASRNKISPVTFEQLLDEREKVRLHNSRK